MKKAAKILLWILIPLILLFGVLYFISQPLIKGILDERLEDTRIGGLYQVQVKTAYFDLFNLGISLKNVQLIPDSTIELFNRSPQIAYLNVKRVSLAYINPWKLFDNSELEIGKIKIIEPELDLYFFDRKSIPNDDTNNDIDEFTALNIVGLELKKMRVQLHLKNKSKISIDRLDFEIAKPVIHPDLFPDISKAIDYKKINLEIKTLVLDNPKAFYTISLDDVEVDNHLSNIKLNGFKMIPKYDKNTFAKKHPYQTDRFVVELEEIGISNLNFERFVNDKILSIEHIDISGLQMEVYRDKNRPFNFNHFPKLPQQQIRSIKQLLEIEKIKIDNSNIVYLEKVQNGTTAGRVDFEDLKAQIINFGNTEQWQMEREFKINAQVNIYGKTPLFVQLNFPLGSNTFYASGQLKKSPMYVFNEIVTPGADIHIENGSIKKLDFNFTANHQESSGEMVFLYNDLEVELLKEKESGEVTERKFLNFLVNRFLLPKENPNRKGEEYHGIIAFDRDKNKSIFNYLWKSVFTGIKDTFLKENKDIQDYTIAKEKAKQTRRELRKQRREERRKERNKNK